jgi:uncharacterized protein involved in type VI secretion and phage assembly
LIAVTFIAGLAQFARIKVNGAPLSAEVIDQLVDARIERSISVPSVFSLRFHDEGFALMDGSTFAIGQTIAISFPTPTEEIVDVFEGEIVSIASEQDGDGLHEFVVSGYDTAHRLGRKTTIQTFQKMSYSEVVSKIARDYGLRAAVTGYTSPVFDYLVQTTTDYAFLGQVARRAGAEWSVSNQTLTFRPRATDETGVALTFRDDLRRFKVRYSAAEHPEQVTVRGWDPRTGSAVVGQRNPPPYGSGGPSVAAASRTKAAAVGTGQFVAPGLVMQSQSEADAVAGALAERMGSAELIARGEAIGRPDVDVGKTISVDHVGTKLSGDYYVTAVEHVFGAGRPLLTRFTAGGLEPSSLVDLLGRGDQAAVWSAVGVTVGVVTNNDDPDKLGRVRVKFPSVSDSEESEWARVLTAGGGSSKGLQFVPDLHDEVLVVFEHGDPRRPYVLGAVWSDKQKPPFADYTKDGKSTSWSIGTPFGQSLAFRTGDAKDQRQFSVLMKDGKTKLLLGEDKIEIFAGDQSPIELKTGQASITLSGNGDVTIKGTNITLDATNGVAIKGTKVEVTAKTTAKVEGTATLELKGGASGKLEASGILELKGSMLKIN